MVSESEPHTLAEAEMSPGIDCAINAAARALAATHGADYFHASGPRQAHWRREAKTVVDAWQEDRRRSAEENIPDPAPSSLRAELAEAKAEIARLAEEKAQLEELTIEKTPVNTIVAAATALRDYDAQFAYPGDEWVSKREQLVRAVVTAVEGGQKP